MSGDEAKRPGRQPDGDIAVSMLVVEHGAIERDRRARTERQIGAVGHHQPRRAVEARAHDFVAVDAVADIDPAGRRSRDADDFILDDSRFADAPLRISGACSKPRRQAKCGDTDYAVTQIHFITDRSIPTSYRIARARDVANLPQAAPDEPDG
jgi:hypothetical protein